MNKVQFNLKNVHYAEQIAPTEPGGVPTFGDVIAIPGAVSLTLDQQGSVTPFYADGMVYYNAVANNGYGGDLEIARFPDKMLQDIWKFELNSDKVLVENANVEPSAFALLYQIDGDANNDFYCLYNCTGTRPGIGGETITGEKTPHTRKSTISATPMSDGKVMARTTKDTLAAVKENWFKDVYTGANATTTTTE